MYHEQSTHHARPDLHYRHYTPEEDAILREMWCTHNTPEIAERLGRTRKSVWTRAVEVLGLPRSRYKRRVQVPPAVAAHLRSLGGISSYSQVAKELGVYPTTLARYAKILGVPRIYMTPAPSERRAPKRVDLQPMELAPDHFAVDQFSYDTWQKVLHGQDNGLA